MKEIKPRVSVVMPCYNEEEFIGQAIESLVDDYFRNYCELIIVDGMSKDGTREVVKAFVKKGLRVRLLENQRKLQAHGLNLGISEAKGEIILRADAHCVYPEGYIKKCVELLEKKGAANVGGVMLPMGTGGGQEGDAGQEAIALAMRHPVGVGDARWHLGNFNGYVDTVYLGTFRKELFDEMGLYDTNCRTNQDGEMNLRITKAGKKIYLDSSIKVIYFPRETLKKLAKQYFQYGRGRCYTTLKHRKITSMRQIGPVVLVMGISGAIGLSFWKPVFLLVPLAYLVGIFLAALFSWWKKKIPLKQRLVMGMAWGIMHISWGFVFICYIFFHRKRSK